MGTGQVLARQLLLLSFFIPSDEPKTPAKKAHRFFYSLICMVIHTMSDANEHKLQQTSDRSRIFPVVLS